MHLIQIIVETTLLLIIIFVLVGLIVSFTVAFFGGGPFVPTPKKAVLEVLKAAKIKKGDILYDIGAGDGRYLHFAEKLYGAKSTGFEIDPFVYMIARTKQILLRWKGKIIRDNFQNHSLKNADIVICYMLPKSLQKYQTKFEKELKKGCKIISYSFHIGSMKPFKEIKPNKKTGIKRIFIYKMREKSAKIPTVKKKTFKTA